MDIHDLNYVQYSRALPCNHRSPKDDEKSSVAFLFHSFDGLLAHAIRSRVPEDRIFFYAANGSSKPVLMSFNNPGGKLCPREGAVGKQARQQSFVGMNRLSGPIECPLPAQNIGEVASSIGHEDITVE